MNDRKLGISAQVMVAIRHPMPYGDLAKQAVQRFETYADLDAHECTIEERELPFYVPDLHIVLADPLRAGHESAYHPGEANVRMADVVIINKCDSATPEQIDEVKTAIHGLNRDAAVLLAESPVTVEDPSVVAGQKVVFIEDGPTLTHGSMSFGAGVVGATAAGVAEIVDPTPYAVGSVADTYAKYPNTQGILPAMGYGGAQTRDLAATIEAMPVDAVVSGAPIDITRVLTVSKPLVRARYNLQERESGRLEALVREMLDS